MAWLGAREESNRSRVPNVDLFGEFGTSNEDLELLADAISTLIRVKGPDGAYRDLLKRYPVVFAEFVVAAGIHHYSKGDYWTWIHNRTGLPRQNYPTKWGELFEKVVAACQLEPFRAFKNEHATRFVAKFLAHGGIPTYCLTDFFEHLLAPTVLSGEHREFRAGELIRVWQRRQSAFLLVDKPVRRFLVHGGDVAQDFLGRCIEMAEDGLNGLPVPDAKDLGLPQRIIDGFEAWLKTSRRPSRSAHVVAGRRFTKPVVSYDPWAPDALSLSLPSQPSREGQEHLLWSVIAGNWSRKIDVTPDRGSRKATRPAELRLTTPFAIADVSLEIDEERARTWRFNGMSKGQPFIVFQPDTGVLVDVSDALTEDEYWLITPRTADVSVLQGDQKAAVHVIEEFPFLSGEWSQFVGRHINLSDCRLLVIDFDGGHASVAVRPKEKGIDRPQLVGGTPLSLPLILDGHQAFEGLPPRLKLPLPTRGDQRLPANRWRIHISSESGAEPCTDIRFDGDDNLLASVRDEKEVEIDLGSRELLGSNPIGTFRITARGPLGLDADFGLICTPRIAVAGLNEVLAPDDDGPPVARISLMTSGRIQTDERAITLTEQEVGQYQLEVPGHLDRIPLTIVSPHGKGAQAEVHLTLPLRRLRWAVAGLTEHLPKVTDRPLSIARDELDQADAPTLIVDLPNADEFTLVSAQLEDLAGHRLHQFAERSITKSRRFSLREVLDTVRSRHDARLQLAVFVRDTRTGWPPQRSVVAHLTHSLHITNFTVEGELVGQDRQLEATWTETLPVTNRVLRFWPLWRIWEDEPLELPVPDGARGYHAFSASPSALPPGAYRVELVVSDPWLAATQPMMPDLASGNCADVMLGDECEVQDYLEALPTTEPLGILEYFLATRNPQSLARLDESLNPQEVPSAVRAAVGFIDIAEAGALRDEYLLREAMAALQPSLLNRGETFRAIADMSGSSAPVDHRLRRLIVELGLLRVTQTKLAQQLLSDTERHTLWTLWTPLILAMDGVALLEGDAEVVEASKNVLGFDAYGWLSSIDDGESASDDERSVNSFPFPGTEFGYAAIHLRMMRERLSLLPSGPLHPDSWTLANFDWLIRVKEDQDVELRALSWVSSCLSAAEADIAALRHVLPTAAKHVEDRWPTANLSRLNVMPYLIGATALIERATARGFLTSSWLMKEASRGYHSPREAFAAAVELYTRDLCLMDLLILGASQNGDSGEHGT